MEHIIKTLLVDITKGLILSILYLEITQANDTTWNNVSSYTTLYCAMIYGARLTGVDSNIVTNAFVTKTVFTVVDDRIKKQK
jgi:hypothetical protein